MEQRKDLKIQPVQVASTDPAFISGLVPGGSDEPKDSGEDAGTPQGADRTERDDAAVTADVDDDGAAEDASDGSGPVTDPDASDAAAGDSAGDGADAEPDPDKPVFEAIDHRGSITVDSVGVRFTLDDQAAEWTWDEIGAVESATSRFGRRLTVTVHTPDRRWYPNEVQAPTKATLKKWTTLLDEILDVYFEDEEPAGSSEETDGPAAESSEAAKTTADADKTAETEKMDKADETDDAEKPVDAERTADAKKS